MIYLINPPVFDRGRHILNNMQEPFSLLQLGAVLEKAGHSVKILDYNVIPFKEEELEKKVSEERPLFIGMTMFVIHVPSVKRLSSILRRCYKGKIVVGGVQATISAQDVLRGGEADIVVRGEGDDTVRELAEAIENGGLGGVKGISYCGSSGICENGDRELISDLDTLPFPARHLVDMDAYRWRYWGIRVWGIMAGRGCPFHCYYCSKLFGDKVRLRSPENVIGEIEYLVKEYGTRGFLFHDDTFTLRREWIEKFLDILIGSNLKVRFRCHTRINTATPELLKKLYRAGCRGVDFGIETADQDLSERIRKGIDIKRVKDVVRWAREANLEVMGNFMLGFPDDTHTTIRKNIRFAAMTPFSFINVAIVTPYPGTALYETLPHEEKERLNFSCFRQSAPEFLCQGYNGYDNTYTIPNKNLTREEILHYYQLMPIYFFSERALRELGGFIFWFSKLLYLWVIRHSSFKESLAATFPCSRSMLLAIGRAFRQKKWMQNFFYLKKLFNIIVFRDSYLYMKRSVFEPR